ncbi:MAG TPA: hypothetical protein VMR62_39550 [Bryobacteraceae bacterium]|jgi:hypothetical protein|nr:hypothetical protein [Bryobacteraceae bacterium]
MPGAHEDYRATVTAFWRELSRRQIIPRSTPYNWACLRGFPVKATSGPFRAGSDQRHGGDEVNKRSGSLFFSYLIVALAAPAEYLNGAFGNLPIPDIAAVPTKRYKLARLQAKTS